MEKDKNILGQDPRRALTREVRDEVIASKRNEKVQEEWLEAHRRATERKPAVEVKFDGVCGNDNPKRCTGRIRQRQGYGHKTVE